MILIKSDCSVSIHENRLIRPTNYMIDATISCEKEKNEEGKNILVMVAKKLKPRETITITFESVQDIHSYDLPQSNDLRLSGSERELNEALMDDSTRKTVLVEYQNRKQDEIFHPYIEEKIPLGLLFFVQANLMARFIRGDIDGYPPFFWR